MTPSRQKAIEGVYHAFRNVRKPATVESCPCCLDKKGISILLSKTLRNLSPDDLTHYASSAFLTVGAVEDYLYFLPRILDILATKTNWWPNVEIVARAIHTAGFPSWPEPRRQALLNYFHESFNEFLAQESSGFDVDSWLCALARLHLDLGPFLVRIAENKSRLIEFYEVHSQCLIDGRLGNGFWDEAPYERQQVIDWFHSPATRQAINAQYGLA